MSVRIVVPRLTSPVKVRAPLSVAFPSVTSPAIVMTVAIVRAELPTTESVPPLSVRRLSALPKAVLLSVRRTPASRIVPPA